MKRLSFDWLRMAAIVLHAYPGIVIGRLTWAVYHGLYERAFSLPATPTFPATGNWIENSLQSLDAELSVRQLAPPGSPDRMDD